MEKKKEREREEGLVKGEEIDKERKREGLAKAEGKREKEWKREWEEGLIKGERKRTKGKGSRKKGW